MREMVGSKDVMMVEVEVGAERRDATNPWFGVSMPAVMGQEPVRVGEGC